MLKLEDNIKKIRSDRDGRANSIEAANELELQIEVLNSVLANEEMLCDNIETRIEENIGNTVRGSKL